MVYVTHKKRKQKKKKEKEEEKEDETVVIKIGREGRWGNREEWRQGGCGWDIPYERIVRTTTITEV